MPGTFDTLADMQGKRRSVWSAGGISAEVKNNFVM
jgi:hypothetical protein